MLADTSRFLSGLTDYAAVVVRQVADPARIRSVQLVGLAPRVAVVVAVLGSGAVDKHTLELAGRAERGPGGGGLRAPGRPPDRRAGRAPGG